MNNKGVPTRVCTDHFFTIGSVHQYQGSPCQDYATSGRIGNVHYAIVADGCSTSRDTDIGCRMLTLIFKAFLGELFEQAVTPVLTQDLLQQFPRFFSQPLSEFCASSPFLPEEAFNSTLVVALYQEGAENVYFSIFGDGCVVLQKKKHSDQTASEPLPTVRFSLDWNLNAPPYLAYLSRKEKTREYNDMVSSDPYGKLRIGDSSLAKEEPTEIEVEVLVSDGFEGFHRHVPVANLESISVFSDGVFSFSNSVAEDYIVERFTSIKLPTGQFLKRTCCSRLRELKNHHQSVNQDDFSMATLIFGRS